MIIDGHCHVASTRFTPRAFFEGVAQNMAAPLALHGLAPTGKVSTILDMLLRQHQDHEADDLIQDLDAAGISKALLLLPDFTFAMKSEITIAEMMDMHAAIRERHADRFLVFAGADPRWGADGLALMERAFDHHGFEGMKLYPPCGYSASDPILFPFYELCQAKSRPVLLHTGPTSPALSFAVADPMQVDEAARRFPDVAFILAHGGVVNVETTLQLCAYRQNVFCDFSGFTSLGAPAVWSKHLSDLFGRGVNHKIIFGTDWPVFRSRGKHQGIVETLQSNEGAFAHVPPREKKAIMGGTLLRLTKLVTRSKGGGSPTQPAMLPQAAADAQ